MTALSLALLDTEILSAVMRKNCLATERTRSCLEVHRLFTFSVIKRYEVLRGLLAKGAARQLAAFDKSFAASYSFIDSQARMIRMVTLGCQEKLELPCRERISTTSCEELSGSRQPIGETGRKDREGKEARAARRFIST